MIGTWTQAFRDANLHMLLDTAGEVLASCMYVGHGKGWVATDADGEVIGYAKSLGHAKELIQ